MNALKGWRTIAFNAATLVLVILNGLTGTVTDERWLAVIGGLVLVCNVLLRFVTNTPVGTSAPVDPTLVITHEPPPGGPV